MTDSQNFYFLHVVLVARLGVKRNALMLGSATFSLLLFTLMFVFITRPEASSKFYCNIDKSSGYQGRTVLIFLGGNNVFKNHLDSTETKKFKAAAMVVTKNLKFTSICPVSCFSSCSSFHAELFGRFSSLMVFS